MAVGLKRNPMPRAVSITPDSRGTWLDLPNGARLWRLRIEAPGATDLNSPDSGTTEDR